MQPKESERSRKGMFNKVFDRFSRRVRGLWERNGTYYVQMRVEGKRHQTRVKLEHAKTVPQAQEALQALKQKRRENILVLPKKAGIPTFETLADAYLAEIKALASKSPLTIRRENSSLVFLKQAMGGMSVAKITLNQAISYAKGRRKDGAGGRAVDVDIIALRHVLHRAVREGHIPAMPFKWKSMAGPTKAIRLISTELVEQMKAAAKELMVGRQFAWYLEILATTGGREHETLMLEWSCVNWAARKLLFKGIHAKKARGIPTPDRYVDISPRLEAALKQMDTERPTSLMPESKFLFPSWRGTGEPIGRYVRALEAIKVALLDKGVDISDVGFHHFRHYFISQAVMAGIDYRTIAYWVGHKDGGVLIGRLYSHLNDAHTAEQAAKLTFK